MRSRFQCLTIGTTLSIIGLVSPPALQAQALPVAPRPAPAEEEPVWHNCLTREVWRPEKQAWCRRVEVLKNLTYDLPQFGTAALTNGEYEKNTVAGLRVHLLNRPYTIAFGKLADGTEAAAVILVANSGGTGNFVHLAVVREQETRFTPIATTLLGDSPAKTRRERVNIESVQILNGQIQVDLISHGPNDAACCPTQPLRQVYALAGDRLTLVSETDRTTAQAVPALY